MHATQMHFFSRLCFKLYYQVAKITRMNAAEGVIYPSIHPTSVLSIYLFFYHSICLYVFYLSFCLSFYFSDSVCVLKTLCIENQVLTCRALIFISGKRFLIYSIFLPCWVMYPIADISVDFMNTMAKQKSLSYIVFFSAEFRNTLVQRPILTIKGIVPQKWKFCHHLLTLK